VFHHFFKAEMLDPAIMPEEATVYAFLGLEEKYKVVEMDKLTFLNSAYRAKTTFPTLNLLLQINSKEELFDCAVDMLTDTEKVKLSAFTIIPPFMIHIMADQKFDLVDCFFAIKDYVIDTFSPGDADPVKLLAFKPTLQAIWAAVHSVHYHSPIDASLLQLIKDNIIIHAAYQ
jgi:hypothetical protein